MRVHVFIGSMYVVLNCGVRASFTMDIVVG
jgi:hypothetical protein